ncbi:MAG TPA: tail fiber domain-containing protein, partial [Rhodanobacteraceae bacterium]|nr:tail fiber domain-containing protein [Rhodanobacteraceae bacterium]
SPAGNNAFVSLDNRSPVEPDGGCPGSWTLDGNAAIPSGSYLGTSDATEVDIKSNGSYVAWFTPQGSVALAYPFTPTGQYSTAIGYNAGTNNAGSTVIGGYLDAFPSRITDSATNQLIVAQEHGVGINTSTGADGGTLHDELTIAASPSLPASNADITLETSQGASQYGGFNINAEPTGYFHIYGLFDNAGSLQYDNVMYVNYFAGANAYVSFNGTSGAGALNVGDSTHAGGGAYLSSGGVWTNASSKTFKDGFGSVDVGAVLEKLVAMPVQTWFYKQSHDEGRHIGPFAEDFAAAFGYGQDDKHIATVDESGVTIAAIQGLNQKVESDNTALKQENAELRTKLDALSARLDQLESRKGE